MVFNGTVVMIDRIWVHENYQPPRIYHDIALIRLKEQAVFSDEVSPICLPKMSWLTKNKLIGKVAFVSGFGDIRFGGPQAPSLRETDLKILNNSYCNENFRNLIESRMKFPVGMRASIVCAGHEQGGKDACQV